MIDYCGDFKNGLAKIVRNNKNGFINKTGEEIIPCIYDYCDDFSEGFAAVLKDGKWGFVNEKGKEVITIENDIMKDVLTFNTPIISCIYDDCSKFSEGLVAIKKDDKWGFINKLGNEVIPRRYNFCGDFENGLAIVEKDNKFGFINTNGHEIIPLIYDQCFKFENGFARIKKDDKFGFIDKNRDEYWFDEENCFKNIGYEDNILYYVKYKDTFVLHSYYYYFINTLEEFKQDIQNNEIIDVSIKNKYFDAINKIKAIKKEQKTIPLNYNYCDVFKNGFAIVQKNNKYGLINKQGEEIVHCIYDDCSSFSEGFARIREDSKWGFVDTNGVEVIPLIYDYCSDFLEGLARVRKDNKCGFINTKGKEVIPCRYDSCWNFNNGFARVFKNYKWGFINKKGHEIIPLIYDYCFEFKNGFARIEKDDKFGFVDKNRDEYWFDEKNCFKNIGYKDNILYYVKYKDTFVLHSHYYYLINTLEEFKQDIQNNEIIDVSIKNKYFDAINKIKTIKDIDKKTIKDINTLKKDVWYIPKDKNIIKQLKVNNNNELILKINDDMLESIVVPLDNELTESNYESVYIADVLLHNNDKPKKYICKWLEKYCYCSKNHHVNTKYHIDKCVICEDINCFGIIKNIKLETISAKKFKQLKKENKFCDLVTK